MDLNNFVVLPNKPKSVKLNARNLRELRVETAQLSQENKDMESRLQQLREVMSHEKEEREKNGAFHWKSAQTQDGTKDKEKKLKKSNSSKIKIRVLKNEPLLERVERVPEPPPTKDGQSRKSRLKGKACGQCEARTAGLMCAECAEHYCVSCFAKFHQKGALRFHHIIPMQAELHTSISTLDVVNNFQKKIEKEEEEDIRLNHSGVGVIHPDCRTTPTSFQPVSDNQMHSKQVLFLNDAGDENEDSLLRGNFDEEESSRSFQQALNEWRKGNTHANREHQQSNQNVQSAPPVSMDVMGTQTGERTHIHIEFRDHGLSYMERLLLKKHHRTQIESYQLLSTPRSLQDLITDTQTQRVEENNEIHEITDMSSYSVGMVATDKDSSDEEMMRDAFPNMKEGEERNFSSFAPSLFPIADSQNPMTEEQSGFFTKPSMAVSLLAQRQNIASTNYEGLDGFFMLGLAFRSVPLRPAPSDSPTKMHTHSTKSEALMSGNCLWRPESSIRYLSEVVYNNQPISIISQSDTPKITQSVYGSACASRPMSHAAVEIMEVQSMEQTDTTHIKEDEEDLLTIASLEEEFKCISAEQTLYVSDGQ